MAGNYNNSAFFYDGLSRVVYGDALVKAQIYFLPNIPANATVLIVGGGTGQILSDIAKIHSSGLSITYVEISARMTALSQKRNAGQNQIEFINQPIEQVEPNPIFDVIITPFLFDNFKEKNLAPLFAHIGSFLKPGGIWLNTDFQLTGKWWQQVLLQSMLLFFKILCGVESWRLPNVGRQFDRHSCKLIDQQTFYGDFIISKVYRKLW